MASVFKRKGQRNYRIAWNDHRGVRREKSSGTTDKRLAERLASQIEGKEIERIAGLVDPAAERLASHRARPLREHFDDYRTHLESLERDDRHIGGTIRYLETVADTLEWHTLADIDAHTLTAHLSEQAERNGTSARTFNAAVTAWRAFARWCVRGNRLGSNPLAGMASRNMDNDRRRVRRDLDPEEIARVIDAAQQSPVVTVERRKRDKQGNLTTTTVQMNAPDRAWAYRIAAGTGFRAGEVSSLTPESFDLDGEMPTVTVQAGYSKRKRRDEQPIRADLANILRNWLSGKEPGQCVCPLPDGKAGMMLKADMRVARDQWIAEARSQEERSQREQSDFLRPVDAMGRHADFHALRVYFISRVVEAGANVKEAMELARHSDPKLTLRTYARVGMHSLSKVLDGMPGSDRTPERQAEALRATGTDDRHAPTNSDHTQKHTQMERDVSTTSAMPRNADGSVEGEGWNGKRLRIADLCDEARSYAPESRNTPARTRTLNPLIKSQLLCQLSYGGNAQMPRLTQNRWRG